MLAWEDDPAGLLDVWTGAEHAILVDTVVSGAKPGTVQRFDASTVPLPASLAGSSTHALGVAEAIELARALHRLRAASSSTASRMLLLAGAPLNPAVERAIDETLIQVAAELGVRL